MNHMNEVLLLGRLVTDPQKIDENPIGIRFRLLTVKSHYSKKKNAMITRKERHNVKTWNQNAEFSLKEVKKGDHVLIKGELHYHIYKTDEGGSGSNAEIIANQVILVNRSGNFKNDSQDDFQDVPEDAEFPTDKDVAAEETCNEGVQEEVMESQTDNDAE